MFRFKVRKQYVISFLISNTKKPMVITLNDLESLFHRYRISILATIQINSHGGSLVILNVC